MNESPAQAAPKRKRRWPRMLLSLLLVLMVAYAAYRYALYRMVEARLDAIRKQGQPITPAELDRWYKEPPLGENATDLYLQAFSKLQDLPTQTRTNLPVVGLAKPPARGEPLAREITEQIAKYLAVNADALRLLHQAAARRSCRYPDALSKGKFPASAKSRQAGKLLMLDTIYQLEIGRFDLAVQSNMALVKLARSLEGEPMLMPQMVRLACMDYAISGQERLLTQTQLKDTQLLALMNASRESESTNAMWNGAIGERCFAVDCFHELSSKRRPFDQDEKDTMAVMEWDRTFPLSRNFWIYRNSGLLQLDEQSYLDGMEKLVRAARLRLPERIRAVESVEQHAKELPTYYNLSRNFLALTHSFVKEARSVAKMRSSVTALALERYRLANRQLPDSLNEIVPSFLGTVPFDPFDGNPLRYTTLQKGYTVYSIGEDGRDDGGTEKNAQGQSYVPGTDITFSVER